MTWVNSNHQIRNTFASLLRRNGDAITVNSDCLESLEEILKKLSTEDSNLRTFRRAIGFSKHIQSDLIPLLVHLKENKNVTNSQKIVNCTIKLLVNLTIPTEYLLPLEAMESSDVGKHSIFELNSLLKESKESFSDSRNTKAVLDHIKQMMNCESPLTLEQCDSVNDCLLLLRNILHVPETSVQGNHSTLQNQIVWNLFTQSIDKIIIFLITCPEKICWSVTMVQLIALLYKDQHVGTLQKLLNLWLEASLSESSEDNESNTSAPFQDDGGSSQFITSDPNSDSSDTNGGNELAKTTDNGLKEPRTLHSRNKSIAEIKRVQSTETEASSSSGISSMVSQSTSNKSQTSLWTDQSVNSKKRPCPSSNSEISDCGYGTQVENQEFVSTSSNDDDQPSQKPVHQKPHTFQKTRYISGKKAITALEKKELRRKKLVKRSRTNIINVKGLMHHLPTDDDISNVLKEFTVDFLLKGYGTLVKDLHTQLVTNIHIQIDTSHFFWLVTYFLKFATQLELDLEHLVPVLSYELLSYLVFQGVWNLEEFELRRRMVYVDLKPSLRRLHLVVTAIREFLQAVDTYQKNLHLNEEDKGVLLGLQSKIVGTQELGSFFLLLLRHYNNKLQSRQYLQDLILTNHIYLLFLDRVSKMKDVKPKFSLMEHLNKFAEVEIMCQYGVLLENFKENGEYINNCIFTMMHHIGGDLDNVSILFQPNILKTFSQIWESDFHVCDDWADLIEYVIHKFINSPRKNHYLSDKNLESTSDSEQLECKEKEKINQGSHESEKNVEVGDESNKKYSDNNLMRYKTQISIIKDLLLQNVISEKQYKEFTKNEKPETNRSQAGRKDVKNDEDISVDKEVEALRSYLIKEGREKYIFWLQDVLLELCYAKLLLEDPQRFGDASTTVEPTVYYNSMLDLPLPFIHWTTEQSNALKFTPFVLLLHKLGLHLPAHTGRLFVRIPNYWTVGVIYGKAQQLGPVNREKIKFDVSVFEGPNKKEPVYSLKLEENGTEDHSKFLYDSSKQTPYLFRYTPLPNSMDWSPRLSSVSTETDTNLKRLDELNIITEEEPMYINSFPQMEIAPCFKNSTLLSIIPCSTANQEVDGSSICDTAYSGLTGMCVSDEENVDHL